MSEVTNRGLWHAGRGLALASASLEAGPPVTEEQVERAIEFSAELAIQFSTWAGVLRGLVEERYATGQADELQVVACFAAFRNHLREAAAHVYEAASVLKELEATKAKASS